MQVLRVKGAHRFKKYYINVPHELHKKIAEVTSKAKERGYQIDFSDPCIKVLTQFMKQVESDLKEANAMVNIDKCSTKKSPPPAESGVARKADVRKYAIFTKHTIGQIIE